MRLLRLAVPAALCVVVSSTSVAVAQPAPSAAPAAAGAGPAAGRFLRVFFDCPWATVGEACQIDYYTQTMTFVTWTRDRIDADVHVLGRGILTGGGGGEITLAFIGRGPFEGRTDTLVVTTIPAESEGDIRAKLADALKTGLFPFLRGTAGASQLRLVAAGGAAPQAVDPKSLKDPWNFWLFTVGLWGNGNGESRVKSTYLNLNADATRVTESLRVSIAADGGYSDQRFSFPGQPTSVNVLRNANLHGRAVRSLTSHWSLGGLVRASQSDFANKRFGLRAAPVVEYNVFPWSQATTQQLTLAAAAGWSEFRWADTTIFDRLAEGRPFSQALGTFSNRESWGSNTIRVLYQNFLDDPTLHRLSISGDSQLQVAKGLSIRLWGEYGRIRDQIFLARGGATRDQVLVRQRALGTDYQYYFGFGIDYTFGSIYNTVVNQRMQRFFLQGF